MGKASGQGTASGGWLLVRAWLPLGLVAGLLGCVTPGGIGRQQELRAASGQLAQELQQQGSPAMASNALRVRLAFEAGADLDLYVTGPLQETVYFANTPSRVGGALDEDLRCDAAAPRIEVVTFDDAPAGRYRVGVDFPERCSGGSRSAPFAIMVESSGGPHEKRGSIDLGVFLPIVLEVDHGDESR